ncbi:MAG TPA: MEMAR_RS02690 family S-layer glycoprotein [Methanoregulaceae archaeon]|nr:MEMAR_RS02690 family S-layer glycoprotein [Methanoregulaceae archaeon]
MTKRLTIALLALAVFVVLAVMPVSASTSSAEAKIIGLGDTVLVGESGLNIVGTLGSNTQIAWWQPDSEVAVDEPEKILTPTNPANFAVDPDVFEDRTGKWYQYTGTAAGPLAFYVEIPTITTRIWDLNQNKDVSGKSVTSGELLTFRIDSNGDQVANRAAITAVRPAWEFDGATTNTYYGLLGSTQTTQGFVDIKVKTSNGATLTKLYNGSTDSAASVATTLQHMFVDQATWYWGNASALASGSAPYSITPDNKIYWDTSATDSSGTRYYPAGTYTVTAEFYLNFIKDNYQNDGADYTGRTISAAKTITITTDTVKIEANKDTVVRSNDFSVTITGKPSTYYFIWVKGVTNMGVTGTTDDMPPMIVQFQQDVSNDQPDQFKWNGQYIPENKNDILWTLVPHDATYNGTLFYAKVKTDSSGVRTVEWSTNQSTKAQKYTIRVENRSTTNTDTVKSDEVDVTVEKGAVTITASGDGSYYLGEEVKFSGTNTETDTVYLFITGPNLPENGGSFVSWSGVSGLDDCDDVNPPDCEVVTNFPETFKVVDVDDDNTWSWKWGTATVPLDAGTYTVFAVSDDVDKGDLDSQTAYGTVSIIVKKPFVSATVSQSTVAKGDPIFIRGTAEGQPTDGVQIWVLGKNYQTVDTETVNSDSSFEYEIDDAVTDGMTSGQYFVVVQHPMQNDEFDVLFASADRDCVDTDSVDNTIDAGYVYEIINCDELFKLTGTSRLQGSDAAEALVDAINSPDIDDTYTKLQFLVEEPVIQIDTIGDRHVGDKFTITAQTNLAVDDEILVEIYSSSFKPTQKSQSGEFSGATGTVLVTKGDTGMNKISFDVDASTFKPDEYIVTETGVLYGTTGTALFNVLEAVPETVAPTTVATTVAPTTVPPTTIPPTATPTKTPTQPGFGALVALIGLGAVAFLVVRRH